MSHNKIQTFTLGVDDTSDTYKIIHNEIVNAKIIAMSKFIALFQLLEILQDFRYLKNRKFIDCHGVFKENMTTY